MRGGQRSRPASTRATAFRHGNDEHSPPVLGRNPGDRSRGRRLSRLRGGRTDGAEDLDSLARMIDRLRTLLVAGLAPPTAWRLSLRDAAAGRCDPDAVERAIRLGDDAALQRALAPWFRPEETSAIAALTEVRAVWRIAREAGGTFAVSLRYLADAVRDRAREVRAVREASVGPLATLRLMTVLPAIGLAFGEALGFHSLAALCGTVPGGVALGLGLVLLWAGRRWARAIIRAAQRADPDTGIVLELLGIALAGGAPPRLACRRVDTVIDDLGVVTGPSSESARRSVLALAEEAGVPAAALLHAEAELLRDRRRSAARERQARAEIRLLLPLAVAGLPAFFCLGVAPLLISLVQSVSLPMS